MPREVAIQRRRFGPLVFYPLMFYTALALGWSAANPGDSAAADDSGTVRRETTADRQIDTSNARPVTQASRFRVPADQHTSKTPPAKQSAGKPHPVKRRPTATASPQQRSPVAMAAHNEYISEPLPEVFHEGIRVDAGCGFEPGCGVEGCVSCGVEVGCGAEVGCGIEGCGIAGCDGTCDAGCDGMGQRVVGLGRRMCDPCGLSGECIPLLLPVVRLNWSQFEFFGGLQAFSGPPSFDGPGATSASREGTASFGLQEGFNYSRPFALLGGGISTQFGLRATQTNASGAEFTPEHRRQIFLTGGLFRRVDYGLQGGLVVDYLYDDWHYEAHLAQLRGEISWAVDCNEFGYRFMAGIQDDTTVGRVRNAQGVFSNQPIALESTDQHRFFYRRNFRNNGMAEMFAGFTEDDDGLLGAALQIPLLADLSFRSGFTYLNPDLMPGEQDHQEETWNVSMAFVWYPQGACPRSRYNRPLFDVADNGSLIVDRQ